MGVWYDMSTFCLQESNGVVRKKSGVIILCFGFCVGGMLRGSGAGGIWRDVHCYGMGVCQCGVV